MHAASGIESVSFYIQGLGRGAVTLSRAAEPLSRRASRVGLSTLRALRVLHAPPLPPAASPRPRPLRGASRVSRTPASSSNSGPRHIALHSNGKWLYSINETAGGTTSAAGSIDFFTVDQTAGTVTKRASEKLPWAFTRRETGRIQHPTIV